MIPLDLDPSAKHRLDFRNGLDRQLDVMVELTPNRYVAKPGDKLTLVADANNPQRLEGAKLIFTKVL